MFSNLRSVNNNCRWGESEDSDCCFKLATVAAVRSYQIAAAAFWRIQSELPVDARELSGCYARVAVFALGHHAARLEWPRDE
jgi:hypothetical protein